MGKPKFSRKKYNTPSHPWQEDRIKYENELSKKFGLKNKREIWKTQTKLKNYRGQARELLAKAGTGDAQSKKESDQLLMHLNRINILPVNSTLDDVLALEVESILSRRLQTLTYLKGFSGTPKQSRQLISHGHIAIDGKKVTVPGYIVTKDEEGKISYIDDSPLNDAMHPARPRADFKSPIPGQREPAPTEDKPKAPETVKKPEEKAPEQPKEEKPSQEPVKTEEPKPETPKEEKPVEEKPKESIPEPKEEVKKEEPETEKAEETTPEAAKEEKPEESIPEPVKDELPVEEKAEEPIPEPPTEEKQKDEPEKTEEPKPETSVEEKPKEESTEDKKEEKKDKDKGGSE